MAVTLLPLDELNANDVLQTLDELSQRIQENNGAIDVRRGVFHDLVLYFQSLLTTQRLTIVQDYLRARSLQALADDPNLADDDLVDDVLSNYLVTRRPGSAAAGVVTMVLDDDVTVTVALGAGFTANGQRFTTTQAYTARVEAGQVVADGDRLLRDRGDGTFAFDFDVEAVTEGVAGQLTRGTALVPDTLPPNYVTSFAAADFSAGLDTESNEELLQRLQQGLAAKAPASRTSIAAMIRAQTEFEDVVSLSLVQFGDAEMKRDQHWIWPMSGGGAADLHARTDALLTRTTLTKTATLIEKTGDGFGVWQFSVDRDEAPGFYEVVAVRLASAEDGTYEVTEDVRGIDLSAPDEDYFVPDLADGVEGAYSRFQTAVIRFQDTDTLVTGLSLGATASYTVVVSLVTRIDALQDFLADGDLVPYGGDLLVRAPVPCFVSLSFTIYKRSNQDEPDLGPVRIALCDVVNRLGFVRTLRAAQLTSAVQALLPDGMTLGAIDMLGRVRYPAGTISYLHDSAALELPDDPDNGVTYRTAQFFLVADDIAITIVSGSVSAGL